MRALSHVALVIAGFLVWGLAIAAETALIPPTAPTATFIVPVNLTNLYPDVKEVGVSCQVAGLKYVEPVKTPVVAGRVLMTLEVIVPLAPPTGAKVNWRCELFLFGSDPNKPYYASYENPKEFSITPRAQALTGEFVW